MVSHPQRFPADYPHTSKIIPFSGLGKSGRSSIQPNFIKAT